MSKLTFMMFIYCQIYWYHMILHIDHLTFMYHMTVLLFFMIFNIKIFLENGEIVELSIWAWFHAVLSEYYSDVYLVSCIIFNCQNRMEFPSVTNSNQVKL